MVKMNFMENEGLSINVWLFRRIFILTVSFSIYIIEKIFHSLVVIKKLIVIDIYFYGFEYKKVLNKKERTGHEHT